MPLPGTDRLFLAMQGAVGAQDLVEYLGYGNDPLWSDPLAGLSGLLGSDCWHMALIYNVDYSKLNLQ